MVSIVAAMDSKRGIGKDNKIPWHIKEDLVHLKNLTKDRIVIEGRKTYESMEWYYDRSGKKMPGKLYIVITSKSDYRSKREDAVAAHSLTEALELAKSKATGANEEIIINGG